MTASTPWVIEPSELIAFVNEPLVRIVDLNKITEYNAGHIPNAVHLDYSRIIRNKLPIVGMLPEASLICQALSDLGISPKHYVVAYDEEGGGKASRFLWTLDALGHEKLSLLNGGIVAWQAEGHAMSQSLPAIHAEQYSSDYKNFNAVVALAEEILLTLEDEDVCLLDARSKEEFDGTINRAARAGHIPGAVNIDWMLVKDETNHLKLKPIEQLKAMLNSQHISPSRDIITYCHSHHRSALLYVMLKHLGYRHVKGYPASWSDWAHRSDTPVEF